MAEPGALSVSHLTVYKLTGPIAELSRTFSPTAVDKLYTLECEGTTADLEIQCSSGGNRRNIARTICHNGEAVKFKALNQANTHS